MGLRVTETGVVIDIRVHPGASANRIDGIEETADQRQRLRVRVTAAPEKGKANRAMIKLLSKKLKLPAGVFDVVSGQTSRNKLVAIAGDPVALQARLGEEYPTLVAE
jgi:uncharacterized protein (TIGR00251 family)